MQRNVLKAGLALLVMMSMVAYGATIAHWDMADPGAVNGGFMPGNGVRTDLGGPAGMDTTDFRISSTDLSGNGNHLTAWTSAWMKWTSDSYAGDFSMTSANSYPAAGTDSEYNPGLTGIDAETITPAAWTVEARFKSTNLSSNRTVVGRDGFHSDNHASLYLATRGTSMSIDYMDVGGVWHSVQVAAGLVTGQWYHVAGVSDGVTLSLYIDGILSGSLDMTGSSTNTALAADIDENGDTYGWTVARGMYGTRDNREMDHTDRFFGMVDEVAISDVALDPASFVIAIQQIPPAAPTGLAATAGNNTVTLDWDDNTEYINGYNVYRSTSSGGSYTQVETDLSPSAYMDDTVVNGTTYYYVVTAVGFFDLESDNSAEVSATPDVPAPRYMEYLNRGIVAVYKGGSEVYVSWRMFGTEVLATTTFNLYRNGVLVNVSPITDSTNYLDTSGSSASSYYVKAVYDGLEQAASETVTPWTNVYGSAGYKDIPLQRPAGGTTPDGGSYTYGPNDCSVADLDGDGQLEIIVKWDPSNSRDNANGGYSGNQILDGYEFDGTMLWRIDLGINIRAGAHYTQFMVYDLDSDGRAEVVCKTADGTTDGQGTILGNPTADYRNGSGYILSGPEYLSVFDGQTGAFIDTVDYIPPRHPDTLFPTGSQLDAIWGDGYGNRVDRFLACVAYLDGVNPSVVMCRGYYTRTVLAAWDLVDGQLTQRWVFDSTDPGNSSYGGQGCHSLSVADVDADGKDEIIYGSCTIDDDGTGLYSTGLGHGDALHVSDMDPARPGLEVWQCHEGSTSGASYRDAATGEIIWEHANAGDVGRACAAHIDSSYPGYQLWSFAAGGTYAVDNTQISTGMPPVNFLAWWNGNLQREFLDKAGSTGGPILNNWWNGDDVRMLSIYNAAGSYQTESINGTKGNPCLSGDLLGDWREELIYRSSDNTKLRILTTTSSTSHRIYTLLHDPQYRLAMAWQNVGYNQPPHPGFYIGEGMATPPTPNIILVGAPVFTTDPINNLDAIELSDYTGNSLTTYAEGIEALTFRKDAGPDWLVVASDGALSGIPSDRNVGENTFTVRVTDTGGLSDTATMTIYVANVYSGTQGITDLVGFAAQWLMTDCIDIPACDGADLDGDEDVTISDFSVLAHNWLADEDLQLHLGLIRVLPPTSGLP